MAFNDQLGMARSYYAATAAPAPRHAALGGETRADLVIVGGGCTGLSAALHAAERGARVVLLEGGRIGWGASGRNGGQIIPGLRKGAAELAAMLGETRARRLFQLSLEARSLVGELIAKFAIACDLKETGHLAAAVRSRDLRHMEEEATCLTRVMDYHDVDLLDARAVRAHVDHPYAGGLLDRRGGHFHTLNYTLGLARAAAGAGATLHEESVAVSIARHGGGGVRVCTAAGAVVADQAVLAGDALLQGLAPAVERRIMPVANYVVATAPLADAAGLIPTDVAISDSRFVVDYYRRTVDGRLLFGGGERYSRDAPADIAAFVRPHLERVFPQLRGVAIEHAWGGLVSISRTRLPHLGREGAILFAHGYSGMGAILSTLAGKLLAEAAAGPSPGFESFAAIAPPPFPGGPALRGPLHLAGMLWYAMRDRL